MLSSKPRQLANDLQSLIRSQTVLLALVTPADIHTHTHTHTHTHGYIHIVNSVDPETLSLSCLSCLYIFSEGPNSVSQSPF